MNSKETILSSLRQNTGARYDMPDLSGISPVQYTDKLSRFVETMGKVGGKAVILDGRDINEVIREIYPDAEVVASSLPYVEASVNPDEVEEASELNRTELGVVEGTVAVAENGCVWVPQTMKERAVCFISEYLVIVVDKDNIVNNMHEAYETIEVGSYGYGCFISGPSKTADIAQALVMGAQAARGVTVLVR